ncbi:VCBS repeat-containing protein [Cryobacterium mannosilyticum]|uniref:VCBS repeat-containing protein n=2 Tax=Cryobacterium mannosilyticum TaxID=1259190 RepID=A0A4R8W431_9MICO|nr:VCBS repeat-containing protein [Cryobacterium mannosilyticum]
MKIFKGHSGPTPLTEHFISRSLAFAIAVCMGIGISAVAALDDQSRASASASALGRATAISEAAPIITSESPPGATIGEPYSFTITATGSPMPSFALSGSSWLSIDAATGVVSGTASDRVDKFVSFTIVVSNGVAPASSITYSIVVLPATHNVFARDLDGILWSYPADGSGGWADWSPVGSGWNSMTAVLNPGNFDEDGHFDVGHSDVLARDVTGLLWMYPGDGLGGWLPRISVGSGWNVMTEILSPGDFDGDGHSDVLARDGTGLFWLYPGDGSGGWLATELVGSGWNSMTAILSPGDFTGDGRPDVLARDAIGLMWLYPGSGFGGWGKRIEVGSGWNSMTAILSSGDFDGDGNSDVLARDGEGALWMYSGSPNIGFSGDRVEVGSGWNGMTAIFADGASGYHNRKWF